MGLCTEHTSEAWARLHEAHILLELAEEKVESDSGVEVPMRVAMRLIEEVLDTLGNDLHDDDAAAEAATDLANLRAQDAQIVRETIPA